MGQIVTQAYDALVTKIHAAVLDVGLWEGLLRDIGHWIGAASGELVLQDYDRGVVQQWHGFGGCAQARTIYIDQFAEHDPWHALICQQPVGACVTEQHFFDERFVSNSQYFQRYLLPNGMRRLLGCRVFEDGRRLGRISFARDVGDAVFGEQERSLLGRLSPHLELACRLSSEFSRLRMQAAVARQALDRLSSPLWVVDESGSVFFNNAAAIECGLPGISQKQGRLQGDTPGTGARLLQSLQEASLCKVGNAALILERIDGQRLTVLVCPLPADSPLAADWQRPLVLLIAHDPAAQESQPMDVFAALYGLSPAECRLATLLMDGQTVAEAADRLGVQVSTVRTQLKSMFWKTGTHRQGELLKLFAGALLLKAS